MNRFLIAPLFGTMALAGVAAAYAQTAPNAPAAGSDNTPSAAAPATTAPAARPNAAQTNAAQATPSAGAPVRHHGPHGGPMASGRPDGDHMRHHAMFRERMHQHDALNDLAKPLSADAVKSALQKRFDQHPTVKSVTAVNANVLRVELQMPDGKTVHYEINRTTGDRRPAW